MIECIWSNINRNIHGENLDPIEEARAFKIYVEEYGWGGISDLASRLGKSASYVDKRIKLFGLFSQGNW
jgi:ParB family transcriptional regulator, chromosome partitioning protein